jgi:hypothetical protein
MFKYINKLLGVSVGGTPNRKLVIWNRESASLEVTRTASPFKRLPMAGALSQYLFCFTKRELFYDTLPSIN